MIPVAEETKTVFVFAFHKRVQSENEFSERFLKTQCFYLQECQALQLVSIRIVHG